MKHGGVVEKDDVDRVDVVDEVDTRRNREADTSFSPARPLRPLPRPRPPQSTTAHRALSLLRGLAVSAFFFSLLSPVPTILADDDPDRVTITITKPLPRPEDATVFSAQIDMTKDDTRGKTVAEALAVTPGVRVTSQGIGGFASASLRGQSPNQTLVVIDGMPLNGIRYGIADLGDIPRAVVGTIDVARGFVPAAYASMASGGIVAVRTVSIPDRTIGGGSAGYGSFDTLSGSVNAAGSKGNFGGLGIISYRRTAGNYRFMNDNGTPYNSADDATEERINNDLSELSLFTKGSYRPGPALVTCALSYLSRSGGVPSLGYLRALATHFDKSALAAVATVSGRIPTISGYEFRTFVRRENGAFRDMTGELGLGRADSTTGALTAGFGARMTTRRFAAQSLTFVIDGSRDTLTSDDSLSSNHGEGARFILSGSIADELVLAEGRIAIIPSVVITHSAYRYDGTTTALATLYGTASDKDYTLVSEKLGVSYRLGGMTILKANIGASARPPALAEIFGDAGFTVPNLDLLPEKSVIVDAGITGTSYIGSARIGYDGAIFANTSENLIVFIKNSQVSSRATNIASTRTYGVEAGMVVELMAGYAVSTGYTYLEAVDTGPIETWTGKTLPYRPKHKADLTASYATVLGSLELKPNYTLEYYGMNFLDRANTQEVAQRVIHSIGVSAKRGEKLRAALSLKNLTSNQISDYMGFPEPGFNWWVEFEAKL